MNKICKEYISDAKKFFPIMGKKERNYLRGIVSELEDCIERENISSKQELYVKYRQPYDLANDYYSRFETDEIVNKIRVSKYIKILILTTISCILIAITIYFTVFFINQNQYAREEMVTNSESLVEDETYRAQDKVQSDDFIEEEIIE